MLKPRHAAERRQFGRRQAFVNAWVLARGQPPLACIVVNISEGGALIELRELVTLPSAFLLRFDSGTEIACETRHQRGHRVGVEFVVQAARPIEPPSSRELIDWRRAGQPVARPPQR